MRDSGFVRMILLLFAVLVVATGITFAQAPPQSGAPAGPPPGGAANAANAMKAPFPPFHIIGNIYYVGSSGLACYIIKTSKGLILLDSGYPDMAPQIEGNIKALGFDLSEVKLLINSHAHVDTAAGWVS